jgi:hypothetical protein
LTVVGWQSKPEPSTLNLIPSTNSLTHHNKKIIGFTI